MRVLSRLLSVQRLLAGCSLHMEWKPPAVQQRVELYRGQRDPPPHDENWRAFLRAKEANSALAQRNWRQYRQGLRRLAREYRERVPRGSLGRALAEDAFFCATHWGKSRSIVQYTLRGLLEHPLSVRLYTYAAAEYWKWAAESSPMDLPDAERMVAHAREELRDTDALTQDSLKRMLQVVIGG